MNPNVPPPNVTPVTPVPLAPPSSGVSPAPVIPDSYVPVEHVPYVFIPPPPSKNILVKYWSMIGGGSLMISLLIHAGVIGLAVLIVVTSSREPVVDFLPHGGSKSAAEASHQVSAQTQSIKQNALKTTTTMSKVATQNPDARVLLPTVSTDTIDVPSAPSLMSGGIGSIGSGKIGSGDGPNVGTTIGTQKGSTFHLPSIMIARCNPLDRLKKLKESGGNDKCEQAVSTALGYLKTKQNSDGSWGASNKGAMTGFALLCYLGRCETPDSKFYGDQVMKGILYLIELSKKNPEGIMCEKMTDNAVPYEHGIATYALGEMYSLARLGNKTLPGMKEAFESGVKTIIKYQHDDGSWVYGSGNYIKPGREDLSVTGWQYQALKAAKLSELKIEGLHAAIEKTVKYLEKKQTKDGGIGGTNREASYNQWSLTGTGALGLQTLGHGKSIQIKKAIKFSYDYFQKEPPTWKDGDLYSWYYYAQAFFQSGGPEWKFWNEKALPEILSHQNKDGSWTSNGQGHAPTAGGEDIYPTALCTLMLEVYYRYLKVGDREQGSLFERN